MGLLPRDRAGDGAGSVPGSIPGSIPGSVTGAGQCLHNIPVLYTVLMGLYAEVFVKTKILRTFPNFRKQFSQKVNKIAPIVSIFRT
jgi:hypothetical protein